MSPIPWSTPDGSRQESLGVGFRKESDSVGVTRFAFVAAPTKPQDGLVQNIAFPSGVLALRDCRKKIQFKLETLCEIFRNSESSLRRRSICTEIVLVLLQSRTTSEVISAAMDHHHKREQSEVEKRRAYLDSLTAESEVRAPTMGQRVKEEVQAVVHSIADKLCIPQKDKTKT